MNARKLGIIVGVLVLALAAFLLISKRPQTGPENTPAATAPAPNSLKVTGVYSDDWLANCAPLAGAAQERCTAALNAQYGKSDAAPLPADKADGDRPTADGASH